MIFTTGCYLKLRGCFVYSAILLYSLSFTNCKKAVTNVEKQAVESEAVIDTLPDDFVTFFERFHTDSAFQLEHIIFPLEGLPGSIEETDTIATQRYFWQRQDWVKHNPFTDPAHQFEHWYEVLDTRLIEHWVQLKGTKMVIQRRFAKLDDGWYLIYYAGMRPAEKSE